MTFRFGKLTSLIWERNTQMLRLTQKTEPATTARKILKKRDQFGRACLAPSPVGEALGEAAAQGRGGSACAGLGTRHPAAPPSRSAASFPRWPGGPEWLLGFRPSPPRSRQPEEAGRRRTHAPFTGRVLGGAGPHFSAPLTGQNPVPRQRSQERRVLGAFPPREKAGREGGGRGAARGPGLRQPLPQRHAGPALLDSETF